MTILWLKALHVSFMVAWFAGIFYLPRLFVNHAQAKNQQVIEQLKGMEKRLLFFITPFAILTVIFGLLLIYSYGSAWFNSAIWLHIKITLVFILLAYHGYCFRLLYLFKHNRNQRSSLFYRIFNEVPVIILFAVIILAYLKPSF
ncbi:CopD family protein [Thalassotalea hakodatensis]|uniref:CopD family protein n=1 Tax=Thalassotalea hakodatensis TaxID=3030492 RepID=UPI0025741D34|nr:CopD family protein [Thalassotalea hakodatensis]